MSGISTHILDLATGRPAVDVPVRLERLEAAAWQLLAVQATDADGRCKELLPQSAVTADHYRLVFNTSAYYAGQPLYPEVIITFSITDPGTNYHMPLLLSPNGYTTYRGS